MTPQRDLGGHRAGRRLADGDRCCAISLHAASEDAEPTETERSGAVGVGGRPWLSEFGGPVGGSVTTGMRPATGGERVQAG